MGAIDHTPVECIEFFTRMNSPVAYGSNSLSGYRETA